VVVELPIMYFVILISHLESAFLMKVMWLKNMNILRINQWWKWAPPWINSFKNG